MSIEAVISELKLIYALSLEQRRSREGYLQESHVRDWCNRLSLDKSTLYNKISMYLARAFANNELPFMFCDAVVNGMVAVIVTAPDLEEMPEPFWSVFLAFDSGEFYREGKRDEDPVEIYTRPTIAKIIADNANTA